MRVPVCIMEGDIGCYSDEDCCPDLLCDVPNEQCTGVLRAA
jgi:hypothetical protein